jgi:hypothetical protein
MRLAFHFRRRRARDFSRQIHIVMVGINVPSFQIGGEQQGKTIVPLEMLPSLGLFVSAYVTGHGPCRFGISLTGRTTLTPSGQYRGSTGFSPWLYKGQGVVRILVHGSPAEAAGI